MTDNRDFGKIKKNAVLCRYFSENTNPRPGLNGALFAERSGAKKREWRTEMAP